ncbi:hypothetical protein JXM67_07840 [candidate division WOR-3 bacterium]|nr:hypothetical protein [candidate division WOR-3 bacterium]
MQKLEQKLDREENRKLLTEILASKGVIGKIKSIVEKETGVVIIVDSMGTEKRRGY